MEPADRLSLLWVWASISAASWVVPVADVRHVSRKMESRVQGSQTTSLTSHPPAPGLSLSPPHNIFAPGERVRLACSPPEGWRAKEFLFYKLKPDGKWDLQTKQKEDIWELEVSTAPLEPQSTFICTYSGKNSAGELLQSTASNQCMVFTGADTVPESSTAILAAHTYETTAGVTNSPGAPVSPALQVTSSSQPVVEENSHSAEPDGPATSLPRSSQPTSHDGIFSSTDSQSTTKPRDSRGTTKPLDSRGTTKPFDSQGSRTTFTNRGDPRSTSQTRTVSEAGNGNGTPPPGESLDLPLVVGCSAAGVLLLVFLAYLFRRKLKGNSKRLSRSFWETPDHQQSRMTSRIKHPSRTHLDLQEMDPDWRILPKSKAASPRHGDPSKQSKADDNADSGAEFEFLDINPTYTLLGYPCSTFFQAENKPPARDTHIYEEPSR